MGIEEKRAVGKWKLESGLGSVLWTTGAATRPMWVAGFVRMMRFVGMVGLVWMVRLVGVVGLVWVIRLVWMIRLVRVVGRLRPVGATVAVSLARRFNLHRLRPLSILVTFQFLVGIETSLESLSDFHVCWAEMLCIPIRNPWGLC